MWRRLLAALLLPLALQVQVALASATSITVDPAVTAAGQLVTASGSCAATPHLTVRGRVMGWYDPAPIYVDVVPSIDSSGSWTATFAMPVLPSIAALVCTGGSVSDGASQLISPSAGDLPSLVPQLSGDQVTIILPPAMEPTTLHVYTSIGTPVPFSTSTEGQNTVARMQVPSRPVRLVLVAIESLGENAEALQNSRVQAWTVDVAGSATAPPVQPSPTIAQPVQASPTTRVDMVPPTDAARPAATGGIGKTLAVLSLAFGIAVVLASRGRERRSR